MKRARKSMESPSITMYELIMRRFLLNNLTALIFTLIGLMISGPLWATNSTYFIVLKDAADIQKFSKKLQLDGIKTKLKVPPHILTAEFPSESEPYDYNEIKDVYVGPVSLKVMEDLGPIAVAAGMTWNRNLVEVARPMGMRAASSMRALVANTNLPQVSDIQTKVIQNSLEISWQPIPGGLFYEVELLDARNLGVPLLKTHSEQTKILIPLQLRPEIQMVRIQVRAMDRLDNKPEEIISGAPSISEPIYLNPKSTVMKGSDPQLSSPVNGFETEGFGAVLEWMGTQGKHTQIEMARDVDFKEVFLSQVVSQQEFKSPKGLLIVGDRIHWRVRLWDEVASPWSASRQFVVGQPHHLERDMFINPEAPK